MSCHDRMGNQGLFTAHTCFASPTGTEFSLEKAVNGESRRSGSAATPHRAVILELLTGYSSEYGRITPGLVIGLRS